MVIRRSLAPLLGMCLIVSGSARAAFFTGLGDLPGGIFRSAAAAVSADGLVVVGTSSVDGGVRGSPTSEAFRWTVESGMQGLGELPGGTILSSATDISADGSIIVGSSVSDLGREAYRWESSTGMVGLRPDPAGEFSYAFGISGDGKTIVGEGQLPNNNWDAVRWNSTEGVVPLGAVSMVLDQAQAADVSHDGSVIVGARFDYVAYDQRAFRWDSASGVVNLPDLPGVGGSYATAVSGDGTVVVGYGSILTPRRDVAFRWDAVSGVIPLPELDEAATSTQPEDVSFDGAIIVGRTLLSSGLTAVLWNAENEVVKLDVFLSTMGVDVSNWKLESATGISADGMTIVGFGINPSGAREAWIAVIPEPRSAQLILLGLAGLALGRARGRRRLLTATSRNRTACGTS